jgi:glycosyltransferase involved in cell wall biosynthesis
MKIAILGCRGIPAIIGGFETFAEEVAIRLVKKGHEVTVYCESNLYPKPRMKEYEGVKLVHIPAIKSKSLEALLYDLLCIFHSLFKRYDLLYLLGDTTALWLILPKIFRKKIVVNTDGIEWWRSKWPWYGKIFLKFNEWIATKITKYLIVDSKEMGKFYKYRYNKDTTYITNGAELIESTNPKILKNFGLEPKKYFTVVCRLEPENNIDIIIKSFRKIDSDLKLVIAGGASYKSKYVRYLKELAKNDNRIIFLGIVTDRNLKRELRTNCLAYIHGHQVGGTNPSLVEAMGAGNIILANKNPFNLEVAGESAIYWEGEEDLREKMSYVIKNFKNVKSLGRKARERIYKFYNWDKIATLHETYFEDIIKQ